MCIFTILFMDAFFIQLCVMKNLKYLESLDLSLLPVFVLGTRYTYPVPRDFLYHIDIFRHIVLFFRKPHIIT